MTKAFDTALQAVSDMKAEHTPISLPELMVEELEAGNCATLVDGGTNWIATIHHLHELTAEQVANEISKRCNAHDALVEALKSCQEQLAHCLGPDTEAGRKATAALKLAGAA